MKRFSKILALSAFLVSSVATAATTGSLILRGNVPDILSITVNSEAVATTLDLATSQTDLKVATVQEKSNSETGYTVSISSANDGALLRSGGSESINYTMKYNGATVDLSGVQTFNNAAAAAVTVNKDVTISYVGQAFDDLVAGDYEDTVTFSISAN